MGLTAIFCACIFRAFAMGIPEKLMARLRQPDAAEFMLYLETGRDVRFSPSLEAFSPQFVETPPPLFPEPEKPEIPVFSLEEAGEVYYASRVSPDIGALLEKPLAWNLRGKEPTVLILHTHATESYTKSGETYEETARWRTLQEDYNMLSIGDHVVQLLQQRGIAAIQDRRLHDYPSYNGSYSSAREAIRENLQQYPTISLILDLHRDASGENGSQLRTAAEAYGQPSAQLMLVLGTNHPGYEENLSLGLKLHALLERENPGITRPLQLRSQRFNQDLLPGALLVEVGAAGNTHPEALRAAEALAEAVALLAEGTGTE